MRNPEQVAFYHSAAWVRCRDAYAKSVGGLCERCLEKGIHSPGEIVHHRTHINSENISDPTTLLSWDNLELLCLPCHNLEHYGNKPFRRYEVDKEGKIIFK